MELRQPEGTNFKKRFRQEGELPNVSMSVNNLDVKIMDDQYPKLDTLDDYATKKVN